MNFDELFTSQRWNILEIISKKPSSPLEISQILNTSVAYISQQLKLLEAANIVKKEKTGFIEKGKARNLYSPVKEIALLTVLEKFSPKKITLELNDHQKFTLRVWALNSDEIAHTLQIIFWKIEEFIDDVEAICFDNQTSKTYFLLKTKRSKSRFESLTKDIDTKIKVIISVEEENEKTISHFTDSIIILYDPQSKILEKKLKGGKKENE